MRGQGACGQTQRGRAWLLRASVCGACSSAAHPKHASSPTLQAVITPTTKAEDHDLPISPAQIVSQGLMTQVRAPGRGEGGGGMQQRGN